jgi:UDP-N-acetylglucosamine 2-epimerase (hydrolysing)
MIGNSSAGIREAPFYGVPSIDIGSRQNDRASLNSILHSSYEQNDILDTISQIKDYKIDAKDYDYFGEGNSDKLFLDILTSNKIWEINSQKQFQEIR